MAEKNKYTYVAFDVNGKKKKGSIEAETESKAYTALKSQGLSPESLKFQGGNGLNAEIKIPGFDRPVKLASLAVFARQFAVLVKAGMPLVKSLQTVTAQTEDKKLKAALVETLAEVERGATLSNAMKRQPQAFPPLMTSLVTVGEAGGFLDKSLESIAKSFKAELALKARIKSATTYPLIVGVVAVLAVIVMLVVVVPVFEEMFAGLDTALPIPTQVLVTLSHNMAWIIPILVIAVAGAFFWYRKNKNEEWLRMKLDPLLLRVPVFGKLNAKVSISRFSRNLSMMITAGVPLMSALDLVGASANNWVMEHALSETRSAMASGRPFSATLAQFPVFPPIVSQMILVGEESGALPEMLDSIGDFYDDEVKELTESLASAIEPIMIVGVGGIVGAMIIALYMPMFSMFGAISNA
jgi:type II secretory pathway component PulF